MKKIFMMAAAAAMTAMTFTACNGGGSTKLNDDVDSIAYLGGVMQSQEITQAIAQGQLDSAYVDQFIKGMKEGALSDEDKSKMMYMQGVMYGQRIKEMSKGLAQYLYQGDTTKTINTNALLAGYIEAIKKKTAITPEEAMAQFQKKVQPIQEAAMEKQFGDWKKKNEQYLATNKTKPGVTTLPSGVQYKVITKGTGAMPTDTSTVKVLYEGKLVDGTVFDSSKQHGNQPMPINMAQPGVIPGWVDVLKIMPVGSKWEVTIPADQAYGTRNQDPIKPFSTLIFTIEIVK